MAPTMHGNIYAQKTKLTLFILYTSAQVVKKNTLDAIAEDIGEKSCTRAHDSILSSDKNITQQHKKIKL